MTAISAERIGESARTGQEPNDAWLVGRAQQGDRSAFDLLVRKYQYKVISLVGRYVNDGEAADVAQEAFIKAWRALKGFKGNSQFYTWLYRIAVNTAKNHLVARGRRVASQDIDVADAELYGHTEHLSDVDTPEDVAISDELERTVMHAIANLPADLRTAISLRELEGLSYEEIAETMECPIGTVRSRIFRAREAIDARIQALTD
ncbi:MAG: RNA polymerase sigma factor RpoE [Nevskiales bacterium]